MRPVNRGEHPLDLQGAPVVFKHYSDAASHLKVRLGRYCSYCERKIPSSLAVEHIAPKSTAIEKSLSWDNFLLACATCNSHKSTKNLDLSACLWPDADNTFNALSYNEAGVIKPNAALTHDLQQKAMILIQLVGLDTSPQGSDHRWDDRFESWGKAKQARALLLNKRDPKMLDLIIKMVEDNWSVWMTVFKGDSDIEQRLIDKFPGTRYHANP